MQAETIVVPVKFTMVWTCGSHGWYAGDVKGFVGVAPRGKNLKVVRNDQGEGCPWGSFEWHIEGPRTAGFIQAMPVVGRILKHAPVIGLYGGGCVLAWSGFDDTWLKNFRKYTDENTSTTHWVEAPLSRFVTLDRKSDPSKVQVAFAPAGNNSLLSQ
ncbi:hypothetical protein TWF106_006576 [Orbilia oligospora]|uniref:Uncharacterized protein n=1 Tax=Orbilia oligospora TaxID=2813651 RepID=A0A6G1LZF2_ORBOL|nr:hypothetical protein TWF788_009929 [Orbilia oligospora]KAF3211766.1 hypothetical protein TWF679_006259 [Orbilia oligospora]KAF3220980.1 hypothetical protein TWF106_006576 [Orbilia oligospora]KAF3240041.1 hypothetical protein TWF192_009579 [Orbilia oligospora]